MLSFDRWGKYRLAYPVNKNEYGVYFLTRFEAPAGTNLVESIKTLFRVKLHESVMRNVICSLDPKQPLTYQRPKSLEEVPASHDVGAFLKENRMEGLLSSRRNRDEDFDKDGKQELLDEELED